MQIQVSGKHIAVGEALRTRVTGELLSTIGNNTSTAAATPR